MTKTCCVGGRHYSKSFDENVFEKMNPRIKKLLKIKKGTCSVCGRNKSQIFTE